jgi:hypothetical protein
MELFSSSNEYVHIITKTNPINAVFLCKTPTTMCKVLVLLDNAASLAYMLAS